MIQLALSILLGAALFALLYLIWLRDRARPEGGAEALLNAQNALHCLKTGLASGALVSRVFAQDDLQFVVAASSPAVQSAFLKERKKLALLWISHVRSQVLSLRKFHLGQSRFYARLDFRTEMNLALAFSLLLIDCRVLQALLYLRGPYAFPRLVGRMISVTTRVCGVSEKSISYLAYSNSKISSGGGTENQAA